MTNEWISNAQIYFRKPGPSFGNGLPAQVQASGDVMFADGWLHLRQANAEEILSFPADAVERIHTPLPKTV